MRQKKKKTVRIQSGKRNRHARVLAAQKSPRFEKNGGNRRF